MQMHYFICTQEGKRPCPSSAAAEEKAVRWLTGLRADGSPATPIFVPSNGDKTPKCTKPSKWSSKDIPPRLSIIASDPTRPRS